MAGGTGNGDRRTTEVKVVKRPIAERYDLKTATLFQGMFAHGHFAVRGARQVCGPFPRLGSIAISVRGLSAPNAVGGNAVVTAVVRKRKRPWGCDLRSGQGTGALKTPSQSLKGSVSPGEFQICS